MRRRQLIGLASGAAVGACAPQARWPASPARRRIRGICFDLFTLFDPRGVISAAERVLPSGAAELCEVWRTRQFEYAWLRAAAGSYVDFRAVTEDALIYAARARKLTLDATLRAELVAAYSRLEPWPDTRAVLVDWKRRGLRLAPLANYAPEMLAELLTRAELTPLFDVLISTDRARTFKPDPRAYALGPALLGLSRQEIAFAAFGGWDAAGARWFGFPTFWLNRLAVPAEQLAPGADATGSTLAELAAFVEAW